MTERELDKRCAAMLVADVGDMGWDELHGWRKWGTPLPNADAHAILTARLAAKVREKYPFAFASMNADRSWSATNSTGNGCSVADSELGAWLSLAEKVCEVKKPAETAAHRRGRHALEVEAAVDAKIKASDSDCCSVVGAVARVRQEEAEFEAECRELWRMLYVKHGAMNKTPDILIGIAEQAIQHYRARFGPKTGGSDAE